MSGRSRSADLLAPILLGLLLSALLVVCQVLCPMAAAQSRAARVKPKLFIVHADWCPPCRVFARAYVERIDLRRTIQDAYDFRSLDWDVPAQRAEAQAAGVTTLPAWYVVRDGRRIAGHVGFTSSTDESAIDVAIASLMADLLLEWPPGPAEPVAPPRPAPAQPAPERPVPVPVRPISSVDSEARDAVSQLATQTRELASETRELASTQRQQLELLSETLQRSIESVRSSASESQQSNTRSERTDISTEITVRPPAEQPAPSNRPAAPGPTASKWLKVLAWAGRTGIALAAPEVAIPGSLALTAAGVGYQWIRRRAQRRQAGIRPLGTADNPIRLTEPSEVRTETKFVVHETDVLGEAFKEAIRRVGNTHREQSPQIIDVLKQVDAAASQLAHGRRMSRRPLMSPVSENDP